MRTLKIFAMLLIVGILAVGCAVTTRGPVVGILRPFNCDCYSSLLPFRGERIAIQMKERGRGIEIVRAEIIQALLQCGAVADTAKNAAYRFDTVAEYTGSSAIVHLYVTRTSDGVTCGSGSGWSDFYDGYHNDYRPFAFAARYALMSLRLNFSQ